MEHVASCCRSWSSPGYGSIWPAWPESACGYDSPVISQSAAESNENKLNRLRAVTDTALAQLDVEDLLVELLDRVRDLLHVDTSAVLLLDSSGQHLVATAARGLEEEVHQGVRVPVGHGFAGQVAALARPVLIERIDHTNVANPILVNKGVTSVLGVPMIVGGRLIGVLHVGAKTARRFTDDDVDLLQRVADRVSLATQTRVAGIDRAATVALQRSALPATPPAMSSLDVATRYVPGAKVGVGGDWYDVFVLPSRHVGVVIGDVSGHGLRAALVMGRIRSALRAYALETDDPADVLTRLDRKIQLFEPGAMTTAAYAVITPSREYMALSIAGHLPPVMAEPGQPARLIDAPPDLPLGAHHGARRRVTTCPLTPGALVLFYTDGLIERRDHPLREGLDQLITEVTPMPAEAACAHVMARFVANEPSDDDIA